MNIKPHHKRRKSGGFNPLDLQFSDDPNVENVIAYDEDTVGLVENLKSYDPNTREIATIALAQLNFDDEDVLKGVINQGIIKVLIERLVDSNHQVVLNTLLALLNLCESTQTYEGKDLAFHILNSGVITVLDGLVQGLVKNLLAEQDHGQALKVQIAIIEYIYRLVSALAEAVDVQHLPSIVNAKLTNESIQLFLTVNINEILTGIASYWHVLAESSLDVCKTLADTTEILQRAVVLMDSKASSAQLKAYIAAMVYNVISRLDAQGIDVRDRAELGQRVLETIFNIISVQILDEIDNLVKVCQFNGGKQGKNRTRKDELTEELGPNTENVSLHTENGNAVEETKDEEVLDQEEGLSNLHLKEAVKIWQDSASAIEVCLGVLINIFEADEDDEEFEDLEEINSDGEEDFGKKGPSTAAITQASSTFFEKLIPSEAKEKLIRSLIDKCKHMSHEHHAFLITVNLHNILLRGTRIVEFALSALMNLCNNYVYKQVTGGAESLNVTKFSIDLATFLWAEFKFYLELLYNQTITPDSNSTTIVKSKDKKATQEELEHEKTQVNEIIKFLLLVLSKSSSQEVTACVPLSDVLHVKSVLFDSMDEQTKLYIIELIALKASPKNHLSLEENAVVADHLVDLLKKDDVMIIGESLNALFDIYVDETYDAVFKEKNFLGVLEYGYNVFKEKIQASRKILPPESVGMLKQHLQNLKRFIKYKKDTAV